MFCTAPSVWVCSVPYRLFGYVLYRTVCLGMFCTVPSVWVCSVPYRLFELMGGAADGPLLAESRRRRRLDEALAVPHGSGGARGRSAAPAPAPAAGRARQVGVGLPPRSARTGRRQGGNRTQDMAEQSRTKSGHGQMVRSDKGDNTSISNSTSWIEPDGRNQSKAARGTWLDGTPEPSL